MGNLFKYVGCFFEAEELFEKVKFIRKNPLSMAIEYPHITFQYRPESINRELFGQKLQVEIVGYGNNGINEGLYVRASASDLQLQEMIKKIEIPHITLALSEGGEAVNTRDLEFAAIPSIIITGEYGGCTEDKRLILGTK